MLMSLEHSPASIYAQVCFFGQKKPPMFTEGFQKTGSKLASVNRQATDSTRRFPIAARASEIVSIFVA
jgi:hypothetical protein